MVGRVFLLIIYFDIEFTYEPDRMPKIGLNMNSR